MNLSAILALISLVLQATETELPVILGIIGAIKGASAPHQAAVAAVLSVAAPKHETAAPANAAAAPFKAQ